MKRRSKAPQQLADTTAEYVLSQSTRMALEKLAEETAREMLADPEFRAELRAAMGLSVKRVMKELRK